MNIKTKQLRLLLLTPLASWEYRTIAGGTGSGKKSSHPGLGWSISDLSAVHQRHYEVAEAGAGGGPEWFTHSSKWEQLKEPGVCTGRNSPKSAHLPTGAHLVGNGGALKSNVNLQPLPPSLLSSNTARRQDNTHKHTTTHSSAV